MLEPEWPGPTFSDLRPGMLLVRWLLREPKGTVLVISVEPISVDQDTVKIRFFEARWVLRVYTKSYLAEYNLSVA